jgi:FKBP-type peptidyl-prolyl cis-trans isomerase
MRVTWKSLLLALGLPILGCGSPDMTAALPPGAEPQAPQLPDDQKAVALGEAAGMGSVQPPTAPIVEIKPAEPTNQGERKVTESKLEYETLKPGDGEQATSGKLVTVHYVGTFTDGREFESSQKSGTPYSFRIGADNVIKGWHQGIAGMRVGEVRKLIIPPELAYGDTGKGDVPPNSTLVFEIELLSVK